MRRAERKNIDRARICPVSWCKNISLNSGFFCPQHWIRIPEETRTLIIKALVNEHSYQALQLIQEVKQQFEEEKEDE